jgi:hypothetical protein
MLGFAWFELARWLNRRLIEPPFGDRRYPWTRMRRASS